MTTYNGKCHCGETTWTVKLDGGSHVLCHCDACKLIGGGCSYTMNAVAAAEDCKLTKGDFKTYTYRGDSGSSVICYFCPTCTSHAWHHQEVMGPDKRVVRTAFLDGNREWGVAVELYGKMREKWQPEIAHTFELGPPS